MSRPLSYAHCGSPKPLLGETIGQCLDRITRTYPDNEAMVSLHQGARFTYRQFSEIVDRAARAYLRLGIRRGDRVAIWSTNNYEWAVTQYATARIGAILVNINPAYQTHEVKYVLEQSRCRILLLIESFKSSNYVAMFHDACPEVSEVEDAVNGRIECPKYPHLEHVIFMGEDGPAGMIAWPDFMSLAEDVSDSELTEREDDLDIDDHINIQYTSGTTGFPKGVTLTHNNILNNGFVIGEYMQFTDQDRLCIPVPFYHCFGMVVGNLAAMTHGAAVIIPAASFDPLATLQAVQDEKCTALHSVPTMFMAMLEHPDFDRYDVTTLRTGITGAAPCPIELMKKVTTTMHIPQIVTAYGQTEASPLTTMTAPDDPVERRVDSVGKVVHHQELKIIDPATGKTVPRGEQGEICFRGYNIMAGYDNNPEATAEAIDEQGWLHSGDLGTMDEEGYVRITGRLKEMVIRGGENIYPREIEEYLHTLDIIYDAAVVGVPDDRFGEEVLACVKLQPGIPEPTEEEFRALCKGKIAHYKIPRYWWVVDEFPMTVTGKTQKFKIRDMAIEKLGLQAAAVS
ncbi:MAG: AMP-binding protein [Phycisphaerales bacterium]|nr:MAG: AMP-binding protein [Phycisphaerales bacterium]